MKHVKTNQRATNDRVLLEAAQQGWGITLRLGFLQVCSRAVITISITATGLAVIISAVVHQ